MKFTLKKIFLVAFILCLVGILLWMFFSKFKEGNFDCGDLKEKNAIIKMDVDGKIINVN
jgi:cbb3-type cytochrome oxidase subunit 3